jgi:hypothetical protein
LFSTLKRAIGGVKHLSYDSRMPRLVALVFALSLFACRTPPLDFDGGFPGADLAGSGGVGGGGGGGIGGGGGGGGIRDMAVPITDMHFPPTSCCGAPGNPGNENGVGKFCKDSSVCTGAANICATTLASNATFCTRACTMNDPPSVCGSGANCQCAGQTCVCVPGECLMPPPGC